MPLLDRRWRMVALAQQAAIVHGKQRRSSPYGRVGQLPHLPPVGAPSIPIFFLMCGIRAATLNHQQRGWSGTRSLERVQSRMSEGQRPNRSRESISPASRNHRSLLSIPQSPDPISYSVVHQVAAARSLARRCSVLGLAAARHLLRLLWCRCLRPLLHQGCRLPLAGASLSAAQCCTA
jgi:hypothetical protein